MKKWSALCLLIPILLGPSANAQEDDFAGADPGQQRIDNGISLPLRWCPPGEFTMGSPADEPGRDEYEKAHRVKLSQGFWLGETEVTQGQWLSVMGLTLKDQAKKMLDDETLYPQGGKVITLREGLNAIGGRKILDSVTAAKSPAIPIYYVSWDDAVEFCAKLTEKERAAGRLPERSVYTLPTEAQWEYACRAGTTTATYAGVMNVFGENNAPVLNDIAWYGGNSSVGYKGAGWTTPNWPNQAFPGKVAGPRRSGQKEANAWGMRDMLGNLYEWTLNFTYDYPEGSVVDPAGPTEGKNHPYRGGAWNHYAVQCRAAKSYEGPSTLRGNNLGFRVALIVAKP